MIFIENPDVSESTGVNQRTGIAVFIVPLYDVFVVNIGDTAQRIQALSKLSTDQKLEPNIK